LIFLKEDILIIDGAVTPQEQEGISKQLNSPIWRFGWPINDAYFSRPCWHSFIAGKRRPEKLSCENELTGEWELLASFWNRIKEIHIPQAKLLGVYANGQTLGQDSPIHRDNWGAEKGATVLMFCNTYWPTCWGGELVFYDAQKVDVIKSVLPRPGRIVIFNGNIPHGARSPAANCDQLRMTIAFKTVFKENISGLQSGKY
jgi:SM-20-related protein